MLKMRALELKTISLSLVTVIFSTLHVYAEEASHLVARAQTVTQDEEADLDAVQKSFKLDDSSAAETDWSVKSLSDSSKTKFKIDENYNDYNPAPVVKVSKEEAQRAIDRLYSAPQTAPQVSLTSVTEKASLSQQDEPAVITPAPAQPVESPATPQLSDFTSR
jgi:hypothetical protein